MVLAPTVIVLLARSIQKSLMSTLTHHRRGRGCVAVRASVGLTALLAVPGRRPAGQHPADEPDVVPVSGDARHGELLPSSAVRLEP